MIFDNLENFKKYDSLNTEKFKIAFEWINNNIRTVSESKVVNLENGIRAIVDIYYPKPIKTSTYENHKKFIDIQIVVKGLEWIFCTYPKNLTKLKQVEDYSEEKDIEFFESSDPINEGTCIRMEPGNFLILYPDQDWHMPCIAPTLNEESDKIEEVTKIVMKIPL